MTDNVLIAQLVQLVLGWRAGPLPHRSSLLDSPLKV